MYDEELVRLRLECVMSMEGSDRRMALISLITDNDDQQLTFACDGYVRDQFLLRDKPEWRAAVNKMLPEVMCRILQDNKLAFNTMLRIVILGVSDGEYETVVEDIASLARYPIRLSEAVLLSIISKIHIYIKKDVLRRQGTPCSKKEVFYRSMPINILPDETLNDSLQKAIENEDYLLAQVLSDELKKRKKIE